ncbi:MAG: hypothetical protein ABIP13_00470 [Tepidiformaceae bacterium]
MPHQVVVTTGIGRVSVASPQSGGAWDQRLVREAGAWPAWRPGHAQLALSAGGLQPTGELEVVNLQGEGFPSEFRVLAGDAESAIAPRVPHYASWSPDGGLLSVVSRAGETLGLTCFESGGGVRGETVTGAPIFSTWTHDSRHLLVHAGPRLVLLRADSGVVVRTISEAAAGFRAPAVSPSGRLVYAEPRDGALVVVQATLSSDESSELARFGSGAVLGFRPGSDDLTVGLASVQESGALSELILLDPDGGQTRLSRGPYVAYSWSPSGSKLALVVPSQSGDGRHYVRLIDSAGEELGASEAFVPSPDFRIWLAFFDQYSQSHSIWDEAGEYLLVAGRKVEDSVHASLGDAQGDQVFAWRALRSQMLEPVAHGQTGFFSRSGSVLP